MIASCLWEAAIQEGSQKNNFPQKQRWRWRYFSIPLFRTCGQILKKYLWCSLIFSKSACNVFAFLTTGAEELYFITSFCWTNTFVVHLSIAASNSRNLVKISGKHPKYLDKFQGPVNRNLVHKVWFFKETKK